MTFLTWCDEVERLLEGDLADVFELPATDTGPTNDVEAARMVRLVAASLEKIQSEPAAGDWLHEALHETLRRGAREHLHATEATLVGLLAPYADSVDAVLLTFAWLDTATSLRVLVAEIVSSFHRREVAGFGRVLAHVPRDTPHVEILFPALAAPIQKQMTKQLVWDVCHLDALAGVVTLANDLGVTPFGSCLDELRMVVAGGDRVCVPVGRDLRMQLEQALVRNRS